jgi:Flp pilus assembly protein TadG
MIVHRLRTRLARDDGSVLITGLFLSIALLMVVGFAVDVGHAFLVKRELSSIADDAALSASQAINQPALHEGHLELNPQQARTEAMQTVAANPHVSGEASATPAHVTVTVKRRVQTILLGIVGLRTLTISASATAEPRGP